MGPSMRCMGLQQLQAAARTHPPRPPLYAPSESSADSAPPPAPARLAPASPGTRPCISAYCCPCLGFLLPLVYSSKPPAAIGQAAQTLRGNAGGVVKRARPDPYAAARSTRALNELARLEPDVSMAQHTQRLRTADLQSTGKHWPCAHAPWLQQCALCVPAALRGRSPLKTLLSDLKLLDVQETA